MENNSILSPEEKAKQLKQKFGAGGWWYEHSITCVEEILESVPMVPTYHYKDERVKYALNSESYWESVKWHLTELKDEWKKGL